MTRTCAVSGDECEAPAGWGISGFGWAHGTEGTRKTCYACGEPVCGNCSRITTWYGRRRTRVCENCDRERGKFL